MAQRIGLWLGILLFVLMALSGAPSGLAPQGWLVIALLGLMVIWWITEAVPVAVTALLPLALLPLLGIARPAEAAAPYADPIIFLFIGGFILAISVEHWGLHKRLALGLIGRLGTHPAALVGGFVLTCALLSMWISNTATALMLMPIAAGVARALAGDRQVDPALGSALVLAVAYGASIGGIGTPVGSPTNLVAMGYLERQGITLSFTQWMIMAVPLMVVLLVLVWLVLIRALQAGNGPSGDVKALLARESAALGPMTAPEWRVLVLFGAVALAWMLREPLTDWSGLSGLSDMSIAIAGAVLLFIVPSGVPGRKLLDWSAAERIPWGIALLFGGGLSMAAAMDAAGVTAWLGTELSGLGGLAPVMLVALLVTLVIFATEVASNTATLTAFLPVIGAVALAAGIDPLLLAFPASIAASLAFMMPIATPPNAIAYGTGLVRLPTMVRLGLLLNLVAIVAVVAMSVLLAPLVMN